MSASTYIYKGVHIRLNPQELRKSGWVVTVTLRYQDDLEGTKYEVKTIHSTRMEAEVSGLALAHRIIDRQDS